MGWGGNDVTAEAPMNEAIEKLHELEAQPGVLCASIGQGYLFADIADMGASVFVVADGDRALAQAYADELGQWIFARRRLWWDFPTPTTHEALQQAEREGCFPVILADTNDNTGGGTPGDNTYMLQTFVDRRLEDACVLYIVDAEAIARCGEAGVGATLELDVGGKSSPKQGSPVRLHAQVMALSDGRFRYEGPMYRDLEGDLGPSAYVRQDGIHVILVSKREQPFDSACAKALGLEPRKMRYVGLKSSGHFRASFGPWAGAIHVVFEPGIHDFTLKSLEFRRLGRRLYPIDEI
jgi:microcystin degradation protein MlrC